MKLEGMLKIPSKSDTGRYKQSFAVTNTVGAHRIVPVQFRNVARDGILLPNPGGNAQRLHNILPLSECERYQL